MLEIIFSGTSISNFPPNFPSTPLILETCVHIQCKIKVIHFQLLFSLIYARLGVSILGDDEFQIVGCIIRPTQYYSIVLNVCQLFS